MSEGSTGKRRHKPPVVKSREEYEAEGWPKIDPVCGRRTRPAHTKSADWPGTVAAENRDGECPKCALGARYTQRSKGNGRVKSVQVHRTPEQEEAMIRQARADLEALWADRRRRGVDPDGVFFEGEKPIHHTPATLGRQGGMTPLSPEENLGKCPNDHLYTHRDSLGHRRCATCLAGNGKQLAARRKLALAAASADEAAGWTKRRVGFCPQGHPYKRDKRGKVHCRPCENESRRKHRASRANYLSA